MEEKTGYEHVATIYNFAKEHGYKVQSFNTSERRNKRGAYNYVEVALVVPWKQSVRPRKKQGVKPKQKQENRQKFYLIRL